MISSLSTDTAKWLDQKWTSRSMKGAGDCSALARRAPTAVT
jgi:hypothetical protein